MSNMNVHRSLSTQQPTDQQKRVKTDSPTNAPLSYRRSAGDTSAISSGIRSLVNYGRSLSVHSSAYYAKKEEMAQGLIARQKWLQEMDIAVAKLNARVDPETKIPSSESSKTASESQESKPLARPAAADQGRFANATANVWNRTQNVLGFHTQYSPREQRESTNTLRGWRASANYANTQRWVNAGGQASASINEEEARQARMKMPGVPQATRFGDVVTYF